MKFAVVEYNSKSGDIWRATPRRPNYLEDPDRVIDPTSFGCYVSALHGEHIPLVKFVGKRKLWPRVYRKITGSWPPYSLAYFQQFDVIMLVHQISDAHEIAALARRLRRANPRPFIVGVPTQPYGLLRPHLDSHTQAQRDFITYMNNCDLFLTVVKETQRWYESLTSTPVVYLPQIYPASYATQYFRAVEHKQKSIFVAGVTDRAKVTQGFEVARRLQKEFPRYPIYVTEIPGVTLNLNKLAGAKYEVIPFQKWREHLPWLAQQRLTINTDYTFTRGRVQVDCAAVGTVSLGGNSDAASDLFPALRSNVATPTEDLLSLGQRLLTNDTYYTQIASTARERLKKYDYDESAARLMMLIRASQES